MFLNEDLLVSVRAGLFSIRNISDVIQLIGSVSGGSINSCYKLQAGNSFFFLKVNSAEKFSGMFLAEAEGLRRMRETQTVAVPQVIATGAAGNEQFLLMDWVEPARGRVVDLQELGRQLALMHKNKAAQFGLDHNNFMGALPQTNRLRPTWAKFFIEQRLEPQIQLALQNRQLERSMYNSFQKLFSRLGDMTPVEKPALVHGDLWSGNFMMAADGKPILIDPAISYSLREVDIAMSRLFGGFSPDFYEAYNEIYPLQPGWEERIDLWNLYPLLIHVNLFGGSYLSELKSCLARYI